MFRTLATPPGHDLFTLALCNDLHIGEEVSGRVAGDWPPSFRQDPRRHGRCGECWTTGESFPQYALGTIADRNHTVLRDLSGLTPLS